MSDRSGMSPEFAIELAGMRLGQTLRVLEWLVENEAVDGLSHAVHAVSEAHARVNGLRERLGETA